MTDPGNPFSVEYRSLVASLEDSIRLGVEQDDIHEFVFSPSVLVYNLPREASAVVRVAGLAGGATRVFDPQRDYDAGSLTRLVWRSPGSGDPERQPVHPDDRSRVQVAYRYRELPSGLTDFSPGSVVGTLARALARELKSLYEQVNEAYRRAFLDTASGVALDNVVALLGVVRNPALRATGSVRFSRRQAAPVRVVVPLDLVVEDASRRQYRTTGDAVIPAGEQTGDATVRAVEPGPQGNAAAGALVVMPTPPRGVDAVTNPLPITGGQEPEPDDALRERARHALERAGNATVGALEFAVRDVDGVEGVAVIDRGVDPDVPLGEVRVRYSSAAAGADRLAEIDDQVAKVVDAVRAAGVMVLAERVRPVTVSGTMVVLPAAAGADAAAGRYATEVVAALRGLGIGVPLSLRRLSALVYQVPGLAELAEAQLRFERRTSRPGLPASGQVGELLPVDRSEKVEPGAITVVAVVAVAAEAGPAVRMLTVRLLAAGERPISFDGLSVHVRVQVKARLLTTPTLPPVLLADVVHEVTLVGTDRSLQLGEVDPGSEHEQTAEAVVSLAAYDAVAPASVQLRIR